MRQVTQELSSYIIITLIIIQRLQYLQERWQSIMPLPDSTITTKFKDLNGIPTVSITQTQLEVLNGKRINTFTAVGNNARTFREGVNASPSWFIDDRINLDNFREELQVAVYNVFLQRKKVPYTANGLNLLRSAMDRICNRYVINGTFAERPVDQTEYDKPSY